MAKEQKTYTLKEFVKAVCKETGQRFSAPNLRKYIQDKLIGGTKRIGFTKRGQRGSYGVYTETTLQRVLKIKELLATRKIYLRDLQGLFSAQTALLTASEAMDDALEELDKAEIGIFGLTEKKQQSLRQEIKTQQKTLEKLIKKMEIKA